MSSNVSLAEPADAVGPSNGSLMDIIEAHLASADLQLPVFHHVAARIQDMVSKDAFDASKVTSLIIQDQVLASQILRLANSPFYSGLSHVSTIKDAVVRLGMKQLLATVMLVTQKSNYRSRHGVLRPYMKELWRHALASAMGAKWLAVKQGYGELAQEAFMGGLLHDIGKLFLLKVLDDIHASRKPGISLSTPLISEVLDTMHTEKGYMLLKEWRISEVYCCIARDHHLEDYESSDVLLSTVRLANLACNKLGVGLRNDSLVVLVATQEAQQLGVSEIVLAELEIAIEDALRLDC